MNIFKYTLVSFLLTTSCMLVHSQPKYPDGQEVVDFFGNINYLGGQEVYDFFERLFYPNKAMAIDMIGKVYYPNGQQVQALNGRVYYPNGEEALDFSGRMYYPNGQVALDFCEQVYYSNGQKIGDLEDLGFPVRILHEEILVEGIRVNISLEIPEEDAKPLAILSWIYEQLEIQVVLYDWDEGEVSIDMVDEYRGLRFNLKEYTYD